MNEYIINIIYNTVEVKNMNRVEIYSPEIFITI